MTRRWFKFITKFIIDSTFGLEALSLSLSPLFFFLITVSSTAQHLPLLWKHYPILPPILFQ